MKKVILAVLFAVSLVACTPSAPEAETVKCDSTCVDSCKVVTLSDSSACCTATVDTLK